MIIHDVTQGSPEWLALRADHHTASEAPAMMGASKYQSRSELLHQKKTGLSADVSSVQQALFDRGHSTEASARVLVEQMVGEEMYPATASKGNLLASLDGMTMDDSVLFEHKLWNVSLAAQVRAEDLDPHYYWQMEQQLLVTGAERVIFVCSDGTENNFVHMDYFPVAGRAEALVAGWAQFDADLDALQAPAPKAVEKIGRAPETLPALHVEVTGMVKASNLDEFKKFAMAALADINTDLQDDQDFADAEKTVKWCGDAETRLAAAKEHILGQTKDIDAAFRVMDEISEEARQVRLRLEKLVKARKQTIRDEIVMGANESFRTHMADLEAGFGGKIRMPAVAIDVAGAIKGKKTIASLRDAANTELARAKVEASMIATAINQNLATLREQTKGFEFLFVDAQQLVLKDNEDLVSLIKVRVSEHKATEEAKAEIEREKIRKEEREKLEQEQAADLKRKEDEAEADRIAEALRVAAESVLPEPVAEPAPCSDPEPVIAETASTVTPEPATKHAARQSFGGGGAVYKPWHARVIDKSALIAAIAAGFGTEDLLIIDQAALDSLANDKRQALELAGVIAEPIPSSKVA